MLELKDIASLILTLLSLAIVPITIYLSLKQPIALRKVKRTQFLKFLSEYHKPIKELLNDLTQLGMKSKVFGFIFGEFCFGIILYLNIKIIYSYFIDFLMVSLIILCFLLIALRLHLSNTFIREN